MTTMEEQCQNELESQRAELVSYLQRQAENALEWGSGTPAEQAIEQCIRGRLESIESALGRFANGELGLCQKCHQSINPERLKALPDAKMCMECQPRVVPRARRKIRYATPSEAHQGGVSCMTPS